MGLIAGSMEKIMSKTGNATNERELTPVELDAVVGGRTDVIKAMGNSSPREPKKLPPILGG